MEGFLDYIPGNSMLHKLNPFTKLVMSFLLCISCFLCDKHIFVMGILAGNLIMARIAGTDVLKRSVKMLCALIKFSLVLFLLQILFVRDGMVLMRLPAGIIITDIGLNFSLLFVMRLLAATMPIGLMLSVTQMNDLSNVLVEKTGIPYRYVFALMTTIRFIPVFSTEMVGIMEAQTARGVEFDTKNMIKKIRLLMPLCVPLLIESVKKIDGAAISTELRGFSLRDRHSGYKQYRFSSIDAVVIMCILFVVAVAVAL